MTVHLLFSTAVLIVAMIAARALPLTARTRYAVLLAGIAKFAVPTAVFRFVPVEAIPMQLRTFGGGAAAAVAPVAARNIDWIPIAWAAIATLIFARWLLLRTRTVSSALRSPAPASPREVDAVNEARRALNIRAAIDVIRSPICEAPAVLRIIRPVIVLPAHGCDDLTGDELRSLVLHECAHVARHDNFASLVQAIATSLLWFHPLVWIASRSISIAREEACDESVADSMHETGAYVDALTKICRAIVAPRTAGASCMASAKLKERLEHLMSYERIKSRAWSHRAIVVAGVVLIALSTIAATTAPKDTRPYSLTFNVTNMGNQAMFQMQVIDNATGAVVSSPRITKAAKTRGGVNWKENDGREFTIDVAAEEPASVMLLVEKDGAVVQRTLYTHDNKTYDGEPVSMTLRDADIRDVLSTFGDLTGLKMDLAPEVQGRVTINIKDVPWDKVFNDLLDERGFVGVVDGDTIHVRKK